LTIASEKGDVNAEYYDRVDALTVQTEAMYERLSEVERWRRKVSLVYPGVDLTRFKPGDATARGRSAAGPRILFATFPRSREEIGPRGVDLLVRAARFIPDVRFDLLTRPWARGDSASAVVRSRIAGEGRGNVRLIERGSVRMDEMYQDYDFTIIPYTRRDGGKECPLSLVEGLACGVPVMISRMAPLAGFVEENRCGVAFDPEPSDLRRAIDYGLLNYGELRAAALSCARQHFDRTTVFERFARLYELVESSGATASRADRTV